MKKEVVKETISRFLFSAILTVGIILIHYNVSSYTIENRVYFAFLGSYLFSFISLGVIYHVVELCAKHMFENVAYVCVGLSYVKMIGFFGIIAAVQETFKLSAFDVFSFMIPYFIYLGIQIYFIAKLIDTYDTGKFASNLR